MGIFAEVMCNFLNDTIRAVDIGLVRLPLGEGHLMARVGESGIMGNTVRIEDTRIGDNPCLPILTSRGAVKIDENLKIMFCCPSDGLEEEAVLPLDIRFAGTDFVSPIPYRNTHMIESKVQDCTGSAGGVRCRRYKTRTQHWRL